MRAGTPLLSTKRAVGKLGLRHVHTCFADRPDVGTALSCRCSVPNHVVACAVRALPRDRRDTPIPVVGVVQPELFECTFTFRNGFDLEPTRTSNRAFAQHAIRACKRTQQVCSKSYCAHTHTHYSNTVPYDATTGSMLNSFYTDDERRSMRQNKRKTRERVPNTRLPSSTSWSKNGSFVNTCRDTCTPALQIGLMSARPCPVGARFQIMSCNVP